jgi:hypothetical protein
VGDLSFWQTVGVALIPLGGVVGGFVAQTLIAGRNVYINSITAERSKWLDKLRINLSAYYSLSASITYRQRTLAAITDDDIRKQQVAGRYTDLEKLEERASLLRLQLNPQGDIDGNVLAIIEALQAHQDHKGPDIPALRELVISHAQWLLKAEWEKVKWEAGGFFYRKAHEEDEQQLIKKYKEWVASNTPSFESEELAELTAKLQGKNKLTSSEE